MAKNSRKAFTLIEMIVVIFVVGMGLIGVLSFFNINMNSQLEAKNELIASGLAQEGADIIRNIVDGNYMNGSEWYEEIYQNDSTYCSTIDRDAVLDPIDKFKCRTRVRPKDKAICFDASNGYYYNCPNSSGSGKTIFAREIIIVGSNNDSNPLIELNNGDCLDITVMVTWSDRSTKAKDIICKPRS